MKHRQHQFWICVNPESNAIQLSSIDYYRANSIKKLMSDTVYSWADCKKFGWVCIKKSIEI